MGFDQVLLVPPLPMGFFHHQNETQVVCNKGGEIVDDPFPIGTKQV